MCPHQRIERVPGTAQRHCGAGIRNRGLDLRAIADDALVAQQACDLGTAKARNRIWLEVRESAAEGVALGKNGSPREPGLEGFEAQALEQRAPGASRKAPPIVVVRIED